MKRMKRNLKRALSLVLAFALVLGMTSVSALADDDTTESTTTTTESVELEVGGAVSYDVTGSYTTSDIESEYSSYSNTASVSFSEKSVAADGCSYVLYYTRGGTTYYLTFSVSDDSLSIGTASTYAEGTAVTYGTDSYLSFTSGDTTYYLNNTDGKALTADTTASTTWSYDTSLGFYCTVSSVNYFLGSFIGYTTSSTSPGSYAPSGSTMISYAAGATSGVYTLSFTEDSTTKYLVLSYNSSATGYLSTTTTTDASEATQITFNGTQLYFTDSSTSTVYYLNIVPNSEDGYLIAQTSSATSYQASWTYDPDVGFFCRKSYTFYLLISAVTTSDTTSYSLVLSQSSSGTTTTSTDSNNVTTTTTTSLLTANASTDITFYMTYSGYYLVLSADTGNLVSYTSTEASATELTYTTDGHLYFTEDDTKYYLVVSANANLSLTTTKSKATEVAYKLANGSAWSYGFTFTTVDSGSESDTLYLSGSPVLAESNMTTITFTGVAAGTTSVTIGGVTYSIDVSTQIITMYVGETRVVSLAGEYDSITVADESIATAELGSTTVNYTDSTVATGGSFVIANKNSGVTYYYSFDYDSTNGLTAGAWTSYYSGTSVTFTSDGYLYFTEDSTNYYLNVSGGVLTASTTESTVWTYDSTNGFTYSVTSDGTTTTYTLYSLITALAPSATAFTPTAVSGGSYILGYAGDSGTTYLTFTYSDNALTVGTTATYSSGTTVTYTSNGYLSFSSGDTTYYLTVDSDGKLTASTTGTAWTYDAETGFFYTNSDSVTYYLSGTGVSTTSGTNMVEVFAVSDSSFELAYTDDYDTYYLTMTASSAGVNTTSTYYTVRTFTWTSDGYLKVTIGSAYYLSVSSAGVLSLGSSSSGATTWSYDPDDGFYYADSNSAKHYLTDYLTFTLNTSDYVTDGYGLTSGEEGTSITFTGVSAGTTTATIESDDTTVAKYTIHVLDADTYVSSSNTPFYSDSAISKKMTSLYLSVGLSYTVYLGSNVSTGGTWEIGNTSVASITVNDDGYVTVTGVSEGTTTLSYTVDGVTYTMPVTIKDYWGYSSSTTVKTYSFYIAELTDSTAYMGILYGTSDTNVGNVDFVEVYEGEVIYISFPYNAGTAVDIFASPDEGYALTMMSSTNSASHYMALDSDDPGSTEFVAYVTAAGYNQIYNYGSEAVFNIVQTALDYDCDGAMGWTRPSTSYDYASSDIYIRSQKLPTVSKKITSVTKSGDTTATDYEEGMVISAGDVINYTVTITQYATTEAITYTNELLSDSLRVKIYLVYSIESTNSETGVVTITGTSTTDADEATEVTFTASSDNDEDAGYLTATIDGTVYYLYLNSSAELCGTKTQSEAGTWTYNLGTGLSYTITVTGEDNTSTTTTYYLAGSAVTTTSGTNVVSILQRDSSSYVLGYSGVETYLTYSWDSDSEKLTVGTASAYSGATGMTYSGGYLYFTHDGTEYYLTVTESSDGTVSLTATSTKSEVTWTYSSTTGFSCEYDDLTYYLSKDGIQTTPPSHVILGRLRSAGEIVLGYGSRSSTLTITDSSGNTGTQYQASETESTSEATATLSNLNLANTTLTEDTTYTYTVSYTVQESDVDLLLTNTVSLSYSYQSEYSSSVMTSATADTATLTVASFEMDDIVIDYGLPVDMDYSSHSTITLTDTDATASHGEITVKDDVITYTLTEPLSETDEVTVKSTGGGEYSFNVYPATQMYYEEDFGSTVAVGDDAEEHALIQYSSGDNSGSWSTVYQAVTTNEDGSISVSPNDTTNSTSSLYRFTQETGVVGVNTDDDKDNDVSVYGSDASYLSNQYDSEYHSEKANVESKPAAFRYYFTGTGTTIYSRTSEDSAYISVKLTYVGDSSVTYTNTSGEEVTLTNGTVADTWYIDTRNVAELSGTTDSAIYGDSDNDATLYNIPVYDITDLPYGDWKVYVYVYPKGTEVNYVYKNTTCYDTGYYAYVKRWTDLDGSTVNAGYQKIYTDGTNLYIKSQASAYSSYGISLTFGSSGTATVSTTSEDSTTSTTTEYKVYSSESGEDEQWVKSSTLFGTTSTTVSLYLPVANSNQSGSVFYLDGIRVYDPAGDTAPSTDGTSTSTTSSTIDSDIYAAYKSDGENDPVVLNIRDALFDSDGFATLTDINGNIMDTSYYEKYGPNNEVYLSPTSTTNEDDTTTTTYDTISFYILNWDSDSYKIYLGMKSPNGTAAEVKVGSSDEITLSNSVDCYYDITDYLTTVSNVTIYNSSGTDVTSDAGTIEKVTVTVSSGLASLTNIKVIGASGYTIADSDSYSDTSTASLSSLTFASIDSDWIVVDGEKDDSSGDDTSGNDSSGTDDETNDSDNTDSGSQDAGGTADDTDTGSPGTQDSDGGTGGVNDADSSTQSTAAAALQIKSVKATYKNGKTTLKVTTSSSVKTLKVAGKSAKLTKTGKNKNVFTVKLNKDQRGKAVKMVMKSSTGKKKTKKILIPKKFKVTAKYKAKTKKTTVTVKTSKEVTRVRVNGKKAKRKKTKNGYTYTITLKKKKGSSVNVVGYNKKKAATVTYSVKVK